MDEDTGLDVGRGHRFHSDSGGFMESGMKPITRRERRLVAAVYNDCERIALERAWESEHGEYPLFTALAMAKHLAVLFPGRKDQILEWGAEIPNRRYRRSR